MAGAIDLFSGSKSITGTNLFSVDKDPLKELDQGVEDIIGKQANAVGNAMWNSVQLLIDSLLGITPAVPGDPSSTPSPYDGVASFINNVLAMLGLSNTTGSINDPTSTNFTLDSLLSWVEGLLLPTNSVAPIVTDPTSSGGVTGFVPLENMAIEALVSLVGGSQEIVDAILSSVGFPPGSGTATQVDQYFTDLMSFLSNPDLVQSATPTVTSTGAWSGVSTTASLAVPIPTGGSVGNVDVVLVWADSTTVTATPPSGFVWPPGTAWPFVTTTGTDDFALWVWAHDVSTTATGHYTVALSAPAPCHGIAIRLGATQTAGTFFDGVPAARSTTGIATTPVVVADTTAANDLALWASWKFSGSSSHTFPAGFASAFGSTGGTNGDATGASAQLMVGYRVEPGTGSTGGVSGSWDHTDTIAAMLIPVLAKSAFDPVAAIEDFITNMVHPTNMLAPMDSLTSLLFPTNVPGLDATKITTGQFPQSMVNITSVLASWVTGTLNALNIPGLDATKIVTGIFGNTQIPALPASQITSGTFLTSLIPGLDATKITSGVMALLQIPVLPASQITTGTFLATLIPGLDATKIVSGVLALLQIPNLPATQVTSGTFLSTLIPGLDATKIVTGTFPQSQVNGLVAAIAAMLTNTSPLNAQNLFNQVESDLIGMVPYSHIGSANPNLLSSSGFDNAASVAANPGWSWNSTSGHTTAGCAQATANGTLLTLTSPSPIQVTQNQQLAIDAWLNYTGVTATASANAIRINVAAYLGSSLVSTTMIAAVPSPAGSSGGWVHLVGSTFTVPAGVDNIVIQLQVTSAATAGTILFDDVSAAKTGLMSGNWMSGIASTVATDIQAMVDATTNAFQGVENLFNTTIPMSQDAMAGITNNVVQNSTAIQALVTGQNANANSGQNFAISFANYPDGAMPNIFTINYSGAGASTVVISGGQAVWNLVAGADRAAMLIYNGANASPPTPSVTNTDYQLVGATVAGAMAVKAGSSSANYLFGRVKDINNYVYAKYTTNGVLQFFAELGCYVAGVQHVFLSNVSVPITTTQWLYCGTGNAINQYQLVGGTQLLATYTDSANVAQIGPAFRGWGWGGLTVGNGGGAPSPGAGVSCSDDAPPSVVGSGMMQYRAGAGVTCPFTIGSPTKFPASFFDTNVAASADMGVSGNAVTIANAGWYTATIRSTVIVTVGSGSFSLSPVVYKNNVAHRAGPPGIHENVLSTQVSTAAMGGSITFYAAALDVIEPGFIIESQISGAISGDTFTGDPTGLRTYWTIALANKSTA